MAELEQRPGFAQRTHTALANCLQMERNVWMHIQQSGRLFFPQQISDLLQILLVTIDGGAFFTPDLQPGTLGALASLAEDSTMPVAAAHLVTKCFHL